MFSVGYVECVLLLIFNCSFVVKHLWSDLFQENALYKFGIIIFSNLLLLMLMYSYVISKVSKK